MRNLTEFSGSVKCYMVSAMTGAEVFFKFYLFVCLCIYLYINDQIVSSSECLIVCSWITIFFLEKWRILLEDQYTGISVNSKLNF